MGHKRINLGSVRGRRDYVCQKIVTDIDEMNRQYNVIPDYQTSNLYDDIKRLIFAGIADQFRLVLYNPLNPKEVYLEKSYAVSLFLKTGDGPDGMGNYDLPSPYEFDVFVSFTGKFLRLNSEHRKQALCDFNLSWFDFADTSVPKASELGTANEPATDPEFSKFLEEYRTKQNGIVQDAEREEIPPALDGVSSSQKESHDDLPAELPITSKAVPQKHISLIKYFSSGKPLLIASYTDSRELIQQFIDIAATWGYGQYSGPIPMVLRGWGIHLPNRVLPTQGSPPLRRSVISRTKQGEIPSICLRIFITICEQRMPPGQTWLN